MSVSWEQLAEYTGGDMVGGEMFVRQNGKHLSLGKLVGPQFVFSEDGLRIANEIEAGATKAEITEELDPAPPAQELEPEHTQETVSDLLG